MKLRGENTLHQSKVIVCLGMEEVVCLAQSHDYNLSKHWDKQEQRVHTLLVGQPY